MKNIKQRLINQEINIYEACSYYYDKLTSEDVDYIVKSAPAVAAEALRQHLLLKKSHVDYIVEKEPAYAAAFLNELSLFTQKHVDIIVKKAPWAATTHIPHMLSEENIAWIAKKYPEYLKYIFR